MLEFLLGGKSYLSWLVLTLLCCSVSARAGILELNIVDKKTGKFTPARVKVVGSDGKFYFAEEPLRVGEDHPVLDEEKHFPAHFKSQQWGEERLFYTSGQARVLVPAGKTGILVEKGIEYMPVGLNVEVPAEGEAAAEVELSRWIDMKKRGWYSGDPHVHFRRTHKETSANFIKLQQAEDVNVVSSLVFSDENAIVYKQYAYGKEGVQKEGDYHLYSGEEFRNGYVGEGHYGHFIFFNISKMIEPVGSGKMRGYGNPEDYPPCYKVFQKVHEDGGIVIAAHSGRGEMPVDLMLGEIDAVEILQSQRWDRRLKPYAEGKPHWYHALNCGFKVPGTSGSDYAYLTTKVPFYERMYVRIDGEYSLDKWQDGLVKGRSFVTTGPLLFDFTVDGFRMGDTVTLEKPGKKVEYRAEIHSLHPVEKIELIRNGEVVATLENSNRSQNLVFSGTVEIKESSWLAVRAIGLHPSRPRKNLVLHSNPVYLEVNGRPVLVEKSAEFFVRWLDDSLAWIETEACFLEPEHKQEVVDLFRKGRRYYEKLARKKIGR